ncbi:eukaryotic translation initiation factor 4B1-like [Arachis ipaensis]|uniref:eukaryotic translation initiation factor 4B1-like n=1 Tax=Arachis ipaensis TaxID=130454 RepID=UPI000A2AF654|nr:eukaryotic translation initiation factor 4B1-like [Arachis ipaensis]
MIDALRVTKFTTAKIDYQDPIVLPTCPRQRTAEELDRDRNRLGGGFRNYGNDRANRSSSDGDDTSNSVPTANKKKVEFNGGSERSEGGGGRPRLVLQPRTAPVNNESQEGAGNGNGNVVKPKGPSPFGEVRPREEVLVEKGQDWKKIDEQLESMKIKEAVEKKESFEKRGFGSGNGRGSPK